MNINFPLILVGGLSGAGKSTALRVFEDLGFFCIDGLPFSLVSSLLELFAQDKLKRYRGVALGLDLRQLDFGVSWDGLVRELKEKNIVFELIFLEAQKEIIVKRYSTTRRPHPLTGSCLGLEEAITKEQELFTPLRDMAHLVIDTSFFSIHDLRRVLQEKWSWDTATWAIRVHLISFGFKYGVPLEADMVLDLRFLPNPYFQEDLRPLSGLDEEVQNFIYQREEGLSFKKRLEEFLDFLLPLYVKEGRYRLTIGFGCTGGRHRSVATTELIADFLRKKKYFVSVEHRHLELG
ncbi:MAG: nucleotide-binding protein [Desulfonauticus sp. 38_4375]|nr:MAG: nucleotide-binding protein [Desulfonauticus sp. 38_4375]